MEVGETTGSRTVVVAKLTELTRFVLYSGIYMCTCVSTVAAFTLQKSMQLVFSDIVEYSRLASCL